MSTVISGQDESVFSIYMFTECQYMIFHLGHTFQDSIFSPLSSFFTSLRAEMNSWSYAFEAHAMKMYPPHTNLDH